MFVKNVIPKLLVVVLFSFFYSCSSVHSMNDFYNKYENKATIVPIPNFALKWANMATGGSSIYNYLKSAKVFVLKDASKNTQQKVFKDLSSSTKGDNFTKLVHLNKSKNNLDVYVLEGETNIERLVFGVNGFDNVLIIDSKLNIKKDLLENLLESINTEDIEFIKEILN